MRRKLALVAVLALLLAGALYAFGRGYTYGAASAIYDQAHGRSRLFLLGCTYWPRTPYEERRGELLSMNYHLSFDVIGGIAPSDYAVQFQAANNLITWGTLRLRFGPGFLEKIEALGSRDDRKLYGEQRDGYCDRELRVREGARLLEHQQPPSPREPVSRRSSRVRSLRMPRPFAIMVTMRGNRVFLLTFAGRLIGSENATGA